MRILCFAMGPAQVLFLCAALRSAQKTAAEVRMVLYGDRLADATRRVMECIIAAALPDAQIVWADDVLDYDRLREDPPLGPVVAALQQRIGADAADEIWVCRLAGRPEQVAMAAFPAAALILCEDGLATYVTYPRRVTDIIAHPMRVGRSLRNLLTRGLCLTGWGRRSALYRWPVKPVSRAHLLLADLLPAPAALGRAPIEKIAPTTARAMIAEILAAADVPDDAPPPADRPRALMMGQCFSRWGTITRDVELQVYRDACRDLTDAGLEVLWKEHPKADEPFFDDLSSECEHVTNSGNASSAWPIEILAPRLNVDVAVSLTSTAIVTLDAIHGLRGYTMADRLVGHLTERRAENERHGARFMARHVRPVEDLLAERKAANDG